MRKLADISAFEQLQNGANAGFVSDMSVFNGEMPQLADIDAFVSVMNSGPYSRYGRYGEDRGNLVKPRSGKGYHRTNAGLRDTSHVRGMTSLERQGKYIESKTLEIARRVAQQYIKSHDYRRTGVGEALKAVVPDEVATYIAARVVKGLGNPADVDMSAVQDVLTTLVNDADRSVRYYKWGQEESWLKDEDYEIPMDSEEFKATVLTKAMDKVRRATQGGAGNPDMKVLQRFDEYGNWRL